MDGEGSRGRRKKREAPEGKKDRTDKGEQSDRAGSGIMIRLALQVRHLRCSTVSMTLTIGLCFVEIVRFQLR
jgi:hypothetical protein